MMALQFFYQLLTSAGLTTSYTTCGHSSLRALEPATLSTRSHLTYSTTPSPLGCTPAFNGKGKDNQEKKK